MKPDLSALWGEIELQSSGMDHHEELVNEQK